TAASYGVHNPTNPERGIYGGTRHIVWLEDLFQERIEDPIERQKFILGAYNVGQGHVFDAQRLAEKYGKDPQKWDDVAYYLLKKSSPKYYNDKVVKYGYCRGIEVVTYVDRIYEVYALYEDLFEA
ncbi:MAG: lytic transglycosylase F, partial [Schleiferiaceae bacterium]|nr:lytic transglycosylase F [Schleiferiaceae bacterium]